MMLSIKAIGLAGALLAAAQGDPVAESTGTRIPRPDLTLLDKPPCVDGALVGRLRRTGEVEAIAEGTFRGRERHWFEFRPERSVFGPAAPPAIRFGVIGNPDLPDRDHAVMLVRREPDGTLARVHTEPVIRDRGGRPFVPILPPPLRGLPGTSWLPAGFRHFARSVRYRDEETLSRGYRSALLGELARAPLSRGWVGWQGGRAVVRRGIYLDELAAMFAGQRPKSCWRPDPRLANPPPSR